MNPAPTDHPAAGPTRPAPRRIESLDALRGIAAIYVLAFHYTVRFEEDYGHSTRLPFYAEHGGLAVSLFFMISGFVIFMTLERTKHWSDFVVSRFFRLYPAYWAALAATFAATHIVNLPNRVHTLGEALGNLAMIHNLFGVPHIDSVYWSLELEICFYACMLLLHVLGALPRIEPILLVWMGLSFASPTFLAWLPKATASVVQRVFLLEHIAWFAAGIVFHQRWKTGRLGRLGWLILLLWPPCVLWQWTSYARSALALAVALSVLFILAVLGRAKFLEHPVLSRLGTLSYTLYLVHCYVGYALMYWLETHGVPWWVYIPGTTLVSFLLADAIHRLVEKPAMNFGKRWLKRMQAARTGPPRNSAA